MPSSLLSRLKPQRYDTEQQWRYGHGSGAIPDSSAAGAMASNGVNGTERSDSDVNGTGLQGALDLNNVQDGALSSMFMIGMSVAIPVCSEAIYHVNAFRLAGISVLIWSIATVLCGLAFDFYSLAFCRMFVGVGEAAIISLAPPYIDDHAPPEKKTLWLACLFLAVPVGYAAGYGYGGAVGSHLGWRAAFILEGICMSPFVLFCFCAKPLHLNMKTASGQEESVQEIRERRLMTFWRHTREIFSHSVYGYLLLGYIGYTGFVGVVAYWGAKAAKAVYDMQDMLTGSIAAAMGLGGALMGGWLLDRMGATIPKALTMSALCCFIPGFIATFGFLLQPTVAIFIVIYALTLLLLFALQAPIQATVLWCVPPNHRALANGLSVLLVHLFGDVPAPPLFGALLDTFKHDRHMEEDEAYSKSLCLTSLSLIVAGAFFLRAAWIGRTARDYRSLGISREEQLPSVRSNDPNDAPTVPLMNSSL